MTRAPAEGVVHKAGRLRRLVRNQQLPGDTADVLRQGRHWRKWLLNPRYRRKHQELARLTLMPRFVPTSTTLLGTSFELIDGHSFLLMYREIFEREVYTFRTGNPRPYIIDGGANIGLSVLFFKRLYPESEIVAFEPDPDVFATLERNVERAGLANVQLQRKALWSSETALSFLTEGSDGGRIATPGDERDRRFNALLAPAWTPGPLVQTARLREYLGRPVDFLKLDIEGAEGEVLQDCSDLLGNVGNIFVEYHSFASEPQTLPSILQILIDAGFRLQIHQTTPTSPRPLVSRYLRWGMDMQLNVYGSRSLRDSDDHVAVAASSPKHG